MKYDYPAGKEGFCHPACLYRRYVKNTGIICRNIDVDESIIEAEKYSSCPPHIDHYLHKDQWHALIHTERGFVSLLIATKDPLLVEPTLDAYLRWLRRRRRSVAIWKKPKLVDYFDLSGLRISDIIYDEFILPKERIRAIRRSGKEAFGAFLERMPEDVRVLDKALRDAKAGKDWMEIADSKKALLQRAYELSETGVISKEAFLRIREASSY